MPHLGLAPRVEFVLEAEGGGVNNFQLWMTDSALGLFSNVVGIFGRSKGVFIFAPVLPLSLCRSRKRHSSGHHVLR
jgi:hypothetical protein